MSSKFWTDADLAASLKTSSDISVPAPAGKAYLPYQLAGIEYCLNRTDTLIADSMGLGKTIQAIGVINADTTIEKVLIVCPASLKANWRRELENWLVFKMNILVVDTKTESFDGANIIVINYDILPRFYQQLRAVNYDLLVLDEAHYLNNPKTKRSQHIFGSRKGKKENWIEPIRARQRIALTGTPVTSKPIDLWNICYRFDPKGLGASYSKYVYRYCAARNNGFGLDVSGASNTEELQALLRMRFMIRRDKQTVLPDLPEKTRQIIELPREGLIKLAEQELTIAERHLIAFEKALGVLPKDDPGEFKWDSLLHALEEKFGHLEGLPYEERAKVLSSGELARFEVMSEARKRLSLAKLPMVVEHVKNCLSTENKIILFAYHQEVIDELVESLKDFNPAVVTGKTPVAKRQQAVDRFQIDQDCRLFIGNIVAAGVGFTLTAASTVIFAELSWVPGELEQAEDRAWRIGQKNAVLVQHLVVEGSLDCHLVNIVIKKQSTIKKVLDLTGK